MAELFVGVMSGTSMDGIDAVLVDLAPGTPRLLASHGASWPQALLADLRAVAAGRKLDADGWAMLDSRTGNTIADAVLELLNRCDANAADITAIGCHGQTVAHSPDTTPRTTLQLGDANRIAERTGITTVNDFRRRDMAADGQGAPLAPAFHAAFLADDRENRVVLNLGGIANVTCLPANPAAAVFGFDTGPANCLMDYWIKLQRGDRYDEGGRWAAAGAPDENLLAHLLSDPYFRLQPPKSTGTQYFSPQWLTDHLAEHQLLDPAVIQATLLHLTTNSIGNAVQDHFAAVDRVLVCGGGTHNLALLHALEHKLRRPVQSTAQYGIDPDWLEAMAFAWLARQSLAGLPGNLPSVTGATGSRILGAIHQAGG